MKTSLIAIFAVLVSILAFQGCGAGLQQQSKGMIVALDAVGNVVAPAYRSSVIACDASERVVIATSKRMETAQKKVADIRKLCDKAFAHFEHAISLHTNTVKAVETFRNAATEENWAIVKKYLASLQGASSEAVRQWADAATQVQVIRDGK